VIKIYLSPERRTAPHGKFWQKELYEHEYCTELAQMTCDALTAKGFAVKIGKPQMAIAQRVDEAIAWNADCYMPIHTNASTDGLSQGRASGTEVFAFDHPASIKACGLVYSRLTALYPSKRGVKITDSLYEVVNTPMLSVYPEIAFHDNPADIDFLLSRKRDIAQALCNGLCDYYGVTSALPPHSSDAPEAPSSCGRQSCPFARKVPFELKITESFLSSLARLVQENCSQD